MAKKIKITRKQIKQDDEFLHVVKESLGRVLEYRNYIVIGVGVVIGALVVAGIVTLIVSATSGSAHRELAGAQAVFNAPVVDQETLDKNPRIHEMFPAVFTNDRDRYAESAKKFEAIRADLGAKREGSLADYYIAVSHLNTGEYDAARAAFDKVVAATAPTDPLWGLAAQGAGLAAEAAGQPDAAIEAYTKIVGANPGVAFTQTAHKNLARVYEAKGDHENAAKSLSAYLAAAGEAMDKAEIEQRLAALQGK